MIALQEGNEIVDTMLEVELSIKGRLYDQALEQLEEVAERYLRYIPAREVLADLFRTKGNIERADEITREARLVSQQIACEHCNPGIESEVSGVLRIPFGRWLLRYDSRGEIRLGISIDMSMYPED